MAFPVKSVVRRSEVCARGYAVDKKAVRLQQKYRTSRLCKTCPVGASKRSANCIIIVRWKFDFIGLHLECDGKVVGLFIQESAAILKLGIMYGGYKDPRNRQQCG